MRPASDSILSAVERTTIPEDRLTEVLASVAHVNQDFAGKLVEMALGATGKRYEVGTQRATPTGRRVDMEIAVYDSTARAARRVGLVWFEVKAGATYQENQLQDYSREVLDLVEHPTYGRVLTIAPTPGELEKDEEEAPARWEGRTWAQVANAADQLGRQGAPGRAHWRAAAMEPDAPARWRYLTELIRRIEEKGYVRMDPLTAEDVVAAPRTAPLDSAIHELIRKMREDIPGVEQMGTSKRVHGVGRSQRLKATREQWFEVAERFGDAYLEVLYWPTENWTRDQRGAPAFWAGITFAGVSDTTRRELDNPDWAATFLDGVELGASEGLLRLGRTKYLAELIVQGSTFEEQADSLQRWARESIAAITGQIEAPGAVPPVTDT